MSYFSKRILLLICLVLQFFIIQASQSVGYENRNYLTLSILPPGIEFSSYYQLTGSLGFWTNGNGFEFVGGSDIFSRNSSKIKYMKIFKGTYYWGLGAEQTRAKISSIYGWGSSSPTAEYNESAIYLSLGVENPLFFDWLIYNFEGGYIFSFVNNFSGDYSKYPHSRPYGSIAIKFRWFI